LHLRTGETISRREYDDKRAQKAGFRNRYDLEQFRTKVVAKSRWNNWQYDVKQHTGMMPTFQDYADLRDVRDRRARLRAKHPDLSGRDLDARDRRLVAADGPLARILDASGRRPLSGRAVGDS
jgi:hypothetical protein